MCLSFLLAFHFEGLGAQHFAILPPKFSTLLVGFYYPNKPPTKSSVFLLPTHVTEAGVKQAKNQTNTQFLKKSLQKLCSGRYLFFSWPEIAEYIPSAYLNVKQHKMSYFF